MTGYVKWALKTHIIDDDKWTTKEWKLDILKPVAVIVTKYTPFTHYKKGHVRKSLVKDLDDFKRDYVDNQT